VVEGGVCTGAGVGAGGEAVVLPPPANCCNRDWIGSKAWVGVSELTGRPNRLVWGVGTGLAWVEGTPLICVVGTPLVCVVGGTPGTPLDCVLGTPLELE